MLQQIPDDLWSRVQSLVASGDYANEVDALRNAVALLEKRKEIIADIRAGIEDYEAGRYMTIEEFDEEFRKTGALSSQ